MKNQKAFLLQIPEPCSQNWADMAILDGERFCDQCQKKVTDVSMFTDTQLAYFFQHKTEHVCVRALTTQLGRTLIVPQQKIPKPSYSFAFAALSLTISLASSSRTFAHAPLLQQSYFLPDTDSSKTNQPEDGIFIKGFAYNEEKRPLSFAHLSLMQNNKMTYAAMADRDGCFELHLPKSLANQDKFILNIVDTNILYERVVLTAQQLEGIHELHVQFNRSPLDIIDIKQIYTMGGSWGAPIEPIIKTEVWNRKITPKKHKHTKSKK